MTDTGDPLKSAVLKAGDILKSVTAAAWQAGDADMAKSAGQVQAVIVGKIQSLPTGSDVSDSKLFNLQRAVDGLKDQLGEQGAGCVQAYEAAENPADGNIGKTVALLALAACLAELYEG